MQEMVISDIWVRSQISLSKLRGLVSMALAWLTYLVQPLYGLCAAKTEKKRIR